MSWLEGFTRAILTTSCTPEPLACSPYEQARQFSLNIGRWGILGLLASSNMRQCRGRFGTKTAIPC